MKKSISVIGLLVFQLCALGMQSGIPHPLMAPTKTGDTLFVANESFASPVWDVTRITAKGQLDTDFGKKGVSTLQLKFAPDVEGVATHLKPQGENFLMDGRGPLDGSDFIHNRFITRLTSEGEVDTTFGDKGQVMLDPIVERLLVPEKYRGIFLHDLVVLEDGSFILLLDAIKDVDPDTDYDIQAIIAFSADGTVDTTFGEKGFLTLGEGTRFQWPAISYNPKTAVLTTFLFSFGKATEGGYQTKLRTRMVDLHSKQWSCICVPEWVDVGVGGGDFGFYTGPVSVLETEKGFTFMLWYWEYSLQILKIRKDGKPDPNFGKKGMVAVKVPTGYSAYSWGQMDSLGNDFLISGNFSSQLIDHQRFPGVMKVNSQGETDMNFGDKGVLVQAPKLGDSYPISCDSKTSTCMGAYQYMRGKTPSDTGLYQCLDRFSPDGKLDTSFGDNGQLCLLLSDPSP